MLHHFEIGKKHNDMGLGYFRFSGDFYIGKDGKYALMDSIDAFYEMTAGAKFNKKIIAFAQAQVFALLNTYSSRRVSFKKLKYTEEEARNRREAIKARYAIYNGNFKKGVYYDADQFLKNEPVDTALVFKEGYPGESRSLYNFWYLNSKGKKGERVDAKNLFAIYDGQTWYVGGERDMAKMWYKDGEFLATRAGLGPSTVKGSDMTTAVILGGAIAGGIVAAASSGEVTAYYDCRFDPALKKFVRIGR